ncbi:MAG TPA: SDR family NAD(P)-dependent oxidoreductase [Sphingomonas sp.]|jgi:NAD(P)-dependent dehydrogenase (short-subunit alcohol dehydrogenase family)|uniref:SDR family NAD(P)-dependent oxidoreductase n=1 Tax=Sphingomonas sp. TaxID=28214 RepID=UPI002ED8F27D
MTRTLSGKVAIVTGGGRGIGRADALALARAGAAVVVNDLGVACDGTGRDPGPAAAVVAEIVGAGGHAVADTTDITDWMAAGQIVETAVTTFGDVDILVNNAGISRFAGSIDGITHDDWMRTLAVNLNGTAALTHWVAAHWRRQGKRAGRAIVNTTSSVGLTMVSHRPNAAYAASKAAIAALTQACAAELADIGVRVNAVAPVARSRISEFVAPQLMKPVDDGFDRMGPDNVAAVVVHLASSRCRLTGKIVEIKGGELAILHGWTVDRRFDNGDAAWCDRTLDAVLAEIA